MSSDTFVASLHHTVSAHTSDVNGVCFSKDKKLATCSGDKTVRLWNTEDYSELPTSPMCGHTYYVHCCTFSPFGTLLATCSTDGKLIIWDVKTGTKSAVLQHDAKTPIRVCKFSPDSKLLISGGDDNNVCLWDVSTKKLLRTFQGHDATVFGCDFSPDCNYIVSGSSDGDLLIWDARYGHGKALFMILEGHDLGVTCCEFSPTFGVYGTENSSSKHFMLATTGQDDLVKLWDFNAIVGTTGVPIANSAEPNDRAPVRAHSSGSTLLACIAYVVIRTLRANDWSLCRDAKLKRKKDLKGHSASVQQCRFSLNGKLLASVSIDKSVRIWDPAAGVILHCIEGHARYITCCAFSANGQYLASGSNDKTVMIWKLTTEEQLIADLTIEDQLYQEGLEQEGAESKGRKRPELWTTEDVCEWLTEIGLDMYTETFEKNHIDGQELLTLNQTTLENDLKVEALGHRNKILRSRMFLMEHPIVQKKVMDAGVPDEYLCPITHEIMKDPVICTDGYTYERAAITSWIKSGKDRSPMTNAELTNQELTPNRSLKMLIQRYLNP